MSSAMIMRAKSGNQIRSGSVRKVSGGLGLTNAGNNAWAVGSMLSAKCPFPIGRAGIGGSNMSGLSGTTSCPEQRHGLLAGTVGWAGLDSVGSLPWRWSQQRSGADSVSPDARRAQSAGHPKASQSTKMKGDKLRSIMDSIARQRPGRPAYSQWIVHTSV